MTVSKEITRLEHSSLKLTMTVGKDDSLSEYDALISEYSKTIQIPGFRKGKVPKDVLVRKFGDALKGEVLGRIIEKSLTETFEGESFPPEDRPLPYSTPQVQGEPSLEFGQDLSFTVVYDVFPKITMGSWKGLEAEAPDAAVGDEDINRELEDIRERNAIVLDRDDNAKAAKGDVVTVNYCELSPEGQVLPGSEREDFAFTLGSEANIFKFDDEIKGMKKGESRDIEKTYPEDFADKDLAGKVKKLRVKLTALKEKKLPDLDDDLAQDVDEKYKTLADLKANIRERLTKSLERRLRDLSINSLLEKIMETTPVDIPESMIRIELESRWRNLARQFNIPPENLDKLMTGPDQSRGALMEEWRPGAVKALHSRLIVENLIKELALEAPDDEVEKEMEDMAAESGSSLEDVKKYYAAGSMKDYLKEEIKERKLFDRLLAENKIKKGKQVKYLDLIPNNG